MPSTMSLLEKALTVKRAAAWARELNLTESAFSKARERGRLSPTLASVIALELGEDAQRWGYVAALEAEPESPLRTRLIKALDKVWRHS